MKTVFAQQQCCHVWAQQTQERGTSAEDRIFFENKTIYSYGYHWPIATFYKDNVVLFNDDSASVSTSKHHYKVSAALKDSIKIIYVSKAVLDSIVRGYKPTAKQITESAMKKCESLIAQANRRRDPWRKQRDINEAQSRIQNDIELIKTLGLHVPKKLCEYAEILKEDFESLYAFHKKDIEERIAQEKRKEEKRRKEEKKKQQENIEKFRNGESYSYLYNLPVMLRIKGDVIETSHGASFPVEHGKKAFSLIKALKESGQHWEANGQQIRLGHYSIDYIDRFGNVKAGCHTVAYSEIEKAAQELNL